MPKPLNFIDSTEEDWRKAADAAGIPVDALKAQIRLSDEIIEEIIREEDALDTLKTEFPELRTWPHGDIVDMLGSVSPRISPSNRAMQRRYRSLLEG